MSSEGARVELYEQAERVGGNAASFEARMDERFESFSAMIDGHFETLIAMIDGHFESFSAMIDRNFEAFLAMLDGRFAAMQEQMAAGFEKQRADFNEALVGTIKHFRGFLIGIAGVMGTLGGLIFAAAQLFR